MYTYRSIKLHAQNIFVLSLLAATHICTLSPNCPSESIHMADIVHAHKLVRKLWHTSSVAQFNQSWQKTVELIESFRKLPTQHLHDALEQMHTIHNFITHLHIDGDTQCIVYVPDEAWHNASTQYYQPLYIHWQQERYHAYTRFYIVYAEMLSRAFMNSVCGAFAAPDGDDWQNTFTYYHALYTINPIIAQFSCAGRYAQQLARYDELINILTRTDAKATYG